MSRQAPDAGSIEALYHSHYGELRRWLAHKLGNASQATDFAQDTFLRLLIRQHAQTQDPAPLAEPRAYLKKIATGLVVDHWRRQSLEQAYLQALAQQPEALAMSPEARLLILEVLQQLAALIDAMKPKVRTAFLLAQLDGLTYTDIAAQMGISVRTVERYMADALYHCHCLQQRESQASVR